MSRRVIYLAGPGVFRPDADELGRRLKEECARQGCMGHWPGGVVADEQDHPRNVAIDIMKKNLAAIRDADAVVADITPFRGPHCDNGTAMEIGYAAALLKPLFAYSEIDPRFRLLRSRIWAEEAAGGVWRDAHGNLVEEFCLTDNLMIAAAVGPVSWSAIAAIRRAGDYLRAEAA